MTNHNGTLPDYLLIADDAGKWHLTDRHGALLLETVTNPDTLAELLKESGARFQIIDPRQRLEQQKGTPSK